MNRHTSPLSVVLRSLAVLTFGAIVGCGSDGQAPPAEPADGPAQTPGIHRTDSEVIFRTENFTLQPGQERFVCYTQTLTEDTVVDGYTTRANPLVHHVVFAKTNGTEPEGSSDCDVLFRFVWEPLFLSGAGATDIDFPEGVGQVLPAGTRLLAQLHLLNSSAKPMTDAAEIRMDPSPLTNPRPMKTYALGNFNVSLPPKSPAKLESVCTVPETVQLVACGPRGCWRRSLTSSRRPER